VLCPMAVLIGAPLSIGHGCFDSAMFDGAGDGSVPNAKRRSAPDGGQSTRVHTPPRRRNPLPTSMLSSHAAAKG
jgi:hypothetical protein